MNSKRYLALVAILLFVCFSCKKETAVTQNGNDGSGKYPIMKFATKNHDFGEINEGDKVSYVFDFENTGTKDLLISNAYGSCGCTIPEYPTDYIKPGTSGKIKVSFNSANKSGLQHKTVTIITNTKEKREEISIVASVKPKAENNSGIIPN